ncbi:hypothetical protein BJ971_006847 [Actinoplanes digitatis]|uniref:Uncharacterized protein n=1 Tax=Actinoplanes digitatis TaxID=1868 RepID=A0A7W7I4T1_9ACTN|nr:hypothetical protein [Actinoplanes digitatis]
MLNVGGSAPSWSRRRMISASRTSSGCMAGAECSPPRPGVPPSAVARPCRATRAMNCCASARLPAACGPVESPSDPRRLGGLPPSPVPSPWGPLGRPVTVLPVSQPCSQAAQSNNRPGSSNMEVPVTGKDGTPRVVPVGYFWTRRMARIAIAPQWVRVYDFGAPRTDKPGARLRRRAWPCCRPPRRSRASLPRRGRTGVRGVHRHDVPQRAGRPAQLPASRPGAMPAPCPSTLEKQKHPDACPGVSQGWS